MKICCGGGLNVSAQWPLEISNACGWCGHAAVQDGYHLGQELWQCRCGTSDYTWVVGISNQRLQHISVYFREEDLEWGLSNYYNLNRWDISIPYGDGKVHRFKIWGLRCGGPGCRDLSDMEALKKWVVRQLGGR